MEPSTHIHLGHVPFVRFLLALMVGIGVGFALTPKWSLYIGFWGLLIVVLIAFFTIRYITRLRQYRYYSTLGMLVLFAWAIVGCLLTWQTNPAVDRKHFSHFGSRGLIGLVSDEPVIRGNHIRFPFAITHAYGDDGLYKVRGMLMLTVRMDDSLVAEQLSYGDQLLIPTGYETVPPPYNPGEFDYRSFLAGKNIWHQSYIAFKQLKKLGSGMGNPIIAYALALRQRMVTKFVTYIPNRDAYSVASALILGYRAEMRDSLIQAFSNTGTIHVLSVSGMHVVIVFWLFAKLLWWMDSRKGLRVVKFMFLLIAVWGYALLTGYSPPVLRASIMVSFVMAATIFRQQNRIYNSIAASAFFLLLYNPGFIVDIGFQLSYLAVLGIVFFRPVMRYLFPVRNPLIRPATDYVGMSMGAQAGAGPLATYYFHQFPLYFLPANLFIVLPASAIMYMGFALLILPAGHSAWWAGAALEKLILLTNTSLEYIEQWPMSSIRGIWPAWWELPLFYGLIVAIAMAIKARDKQWIYGILGCVTVLVCTSFLGAFNGAGRQAIIFNVRRSLAIGLVDRAQAWLYTDLASIDDRTIGYSVLPALEKHASVDAVHFLAHNREYRDQLVYAKGGILQFGNARLVVYDGQVRYGERLKVDVVVLRNNPPDSLMSLLESIDCSQLVLDGSNDNSTIERWKAEAEAASIPLYVLKDNVAFILNDDSNQAE